MKRNNHVCNCPGCLCQNDGAIEILRGAIDCETDEISAAAHRGRYDAAIYIAQELIQVLKAIEAYDARNAKPKTKKGKR